MIPSLAVCLMVRNEAKCLPICLGSLEQQVDAIYVTDTGSTDETIAVAAGFGAKIRHFRWQDDFSAARNASILNVDEEWILMLDADDYFPPGEIGKLRKELAGMENKTCAASLRYWVDARFTPLQALKLVRNRRQACFEGLIHETAERWLASRRAKGWGCEDLDVEIVHTGYSPESLPEKLQRNLPLLMAEWGRCTQGFYGDSLPERKLEIGAELGLGLAHAGQLNEAILLLRQLIGELVLLKSPGFRSRYSFSTLVNYLWVLKQAGRDLEGLELLRSLEPDLADSSFYQLHRGLEELACGQFSSARLWLDRFIPWRARRCFDAPIPREYLGAAFWRDLGASYFGEGDLQKAADCFRHCSALEPDNREYQLRLQACSR